tara:strand:- start:75 stop:239 length:165 start_codon:yes stop_codon:yes gene_type:complete
MNSEEELINELKKDINQCDLLEDLFGLTMGMGEHFYTVDEGDYLENLRQYLKDQ